MRLSLVSMPWQALDTPSLPIGLLTECVRRTGADRPVSEYHGNLAWAAYLISATNGELGPAEYTTVSEMVFHGIGDWVFAGSLCGNGGWARDRLARYAGHRGLDVSAAVGMRALVDGFIDEAAAEVLAQRPDVVGFTSTFMQNVPSLALARRLKRLRPDLRVVFGGGNCDGPMGHALHRNYGFVDYVVRGEGEAVFPRLLDRIEAGAPVADLPGVCWRRGTGSVANPPSRTPLGIGAVPAPNYDRWKADFDASPIADHLTPWLVVEGARGCWWGEKHQCTFCGLNGSSIRFRSKPAEVFWEELADLVRRHRILDVVPVDNIMDMDYVRTLLPLVEKSGWDLRIHYEIKSNLRTEQVAALAAAGVVNVQPGIENLSGRVLGIMDKGVDGATNVRLLRDGENNDMTIEWNYLYGFPGEQPEDYLTVIEQLPALVHLQPPSVANRIVLERYSPNYDRPEIGFARRRPAEFYRHVYDLPEDELSGLAYFFDTDEQGITGEVVAALRAAVAAWRSGHHTSTLLLRVDEPTVLEIEDDRRGWPRRTHRLLGWEAAAYRELDRCQTGTALAKRLRAKGFEIDGEVLGAWLEDQRRHGLVFVDGGRWVAIATRNVPIRMPETIGA
ncbi:RiPP maturation radical SAM C-methyltransferase [Amycolatopsis samaneae]|uniref:RiPP maturation radical SAM C-methyltransferase n=1 Tax=Amycolatopsis samaneae TaxID=664691 RepID=A0ABW5GR39_9PSEU